MYNYIITYIYIYTYIKHNITSEKANYTIQVDAKHIADNRRFCKKKS